MRTHPPCLARQAPTDNPSSNFPPRFLTCVFTAASSFVVSPCLRYPRFTKKQLTDHTGCSSMGLRVRAFSRRR